MSDKIVTLRPGGRKLLTGVAENWTKAEKMLERRQGDSHA